MIDEPFHIEQKIYKMICWLFFILYNIDSLDIEYLIYNYIIYNI